MGCGSNGYLILNHCCLLDMCGASEAPTDPPGAPEGVEGAPRGGERGCLLGLVLVWGPPTITLPRPPGSPGLQVESGALALGVLTTCLCCFLSPGIPKKPTFLLPHFTLIVSCLSPDFIVVLGGSEWEEKGPHYLV